MDDNSALNAETSPSSGYSNDGSPDFDNIDGSLQAPEAPGEALTTGEGGEKAPEKAHESHIPYDRFKEVNEKVKDFESKYSDAERRAARLEGELNALRALQFQQASQNQHQARPQQQYDFENVAAMTKEQIHERFEEDPIGFLGNLARQMRYEAKQHVMQELGKTEQEKTVKSAFDDYAKNNPDFIEMVQRGDIKSFLDKNKFHNAITAHMVLKAQNEKASLEADKQKAIDEAVKKAKEDVIKEYQTKGKLATTLGGTAAPTPAAAQDDMLKNPDKYGGTVSVLAERLSRFRAGR